jgi:hypothetical protein
MSDIQLLKELFVSGTDMVITKGELITGLFNIFICSVSGTDNTKYN